MKKCVLDWLDPTGLVTVSLISKNKGRNQRAEVSKSALSHGLMCYWLM